LGEGLKRSLRFQRLLHDEARSELELSATEAVYRHQVGSPPFRAPSAAIEFGLVSFLQLAQRITGSKLVPLRVRLQHTAPRDPSRHRACFGPALEFDAPVDELVLDRASLERPLLGADPVLSRIVEAHASAALSRLPTSSDVDARVRAHISELLTQGTPSIELVCERLRLSRRTLQRQLTALGTSFAIELDRTRHELSLRYLADASISLQEAAFLLGYSDSSAFHRAFIRWTGQAPSGWRTRTIQLARPVER
jgi:AraC-like DNA-binding protein